MEDRLPQNKSFNFDESQRIHFFVLMDHAFGVSLYHSESNHKRNYTAL